MSDLVNGIEARNGRSNIFQTGLVIINGKEDSAEIDRRDPTSSQYLRSDEAHRIFPMELCFLRKDKMPMGANDMASIQSDVEVFTNFAGITETDQQRMDTESNYTVIGITRNEPMHSGMLGRARGRRLALIVGGTSTIRCESKYPIPVGTPLIWRAPRIAPGESNDPKNMARALAEIEPYDPVNNGIHSPKMHEAIRRHRGAGTYELDSVSSNSGVSRSHQADAQIYESLLSVGFTAALLVLEKMGGAALSPDEKMQVANIMGLASGTNNNNGKPSKKGLEFREEFADAVFSAEFNNQTGTSQASSANLAFDLGLGDINTGQDGSQTALARMQVVQFDNLVRAILQKDRNIRDRIFGLSLSSGKPTGDIDVLLYKS